MHDAPNKEVQELAALHSLGLLDPETQENFERHVRSGCAVCHQELSRFREAAADIVCSAEEAAPPAHLRAKLLDRIQPPRSSIARTSEMEWRSTPFPGIQVKVLFADPATGATTSLLRMEAGAKYPPHRHAGLEHIYVLEGDLAFHDHTLYAGDYEASDSDTDHAPATSQGGCLVLVMHNQRDEILARA